MIKRLGKCLEQNIEDFEEINKNLDAFLNKTSQTKSLLKSLISIWSHDEDSKKISSFYVITKVVTKKPELFTYITKSMFTAYIKSVTKGSPSAQAATTFMQKCLVELYSLNIQEAYLQAFVFIRQNALSLKKAYSTADKNDVRSVYNWQFINSLKLWASFVSLKSQECEYISSLIHPLVNIIVGTIRLVPSENWIPLRFHCIRMLHQLSGNLDALDDSPVVQKFFIPTIPLLMDLFQLVNFNKKQNVISKSPFDLRLMLHFSKSLSNESGIKDAVTETLHDLLFEALALNMDNLSFPELTVPLVNQMKQFLKLCKYPKGKELFRSLIALVNQHSTFVSKHRMTIKNISDLREVNIRINQLKMKESQMFTAFKKHCEERRQYLAKLTQLKLKNAPEEEDDLEDINKDHVSEEALKKKKILDKHKKRKLEKMNLTEADDEDNSDDDESDPSNSDDESVESYDMDDGNETVHISKEEAKKEKRSKSSKDFNLFEALNAKEDDDRDDAVSIATSCQDYDDDLLDDFQFSDEYEDVDKPDDENQQAEMDIEYNATEPEKEVNEKKTKKKAKRNFNGNTANQKPGPVSAKKTKKVKRMKSLKKAKETQFKKIDNPIFDN